MYRFLLIIVIGIIMPQLNVLPINVSQNIELKNESASANSIKSNDDFSQYIDLHLTKNKEVENINDVDGVNSEAKKNSSVTDTKLDTKKTEDLVDNANTSTNINDEADDTTFVQNIAASGKKDQIESNAKNQLALIESEQLMSFLTKADNTLINQSADFFSVRPSSEKLSVEKKAYDETKLLLKASALVADLSMVAKAVVNDEVAVAPTTTEKARSKETLVLGDVAKATDKDSAETTVVKSAVGSLNDGKNKDMTPASADGVKPSVKKTVWSEADVESKTGLTSPSKTDVKQTNISNDKINTEPQKHSQPLSAEPLVDNDESASLTAEQTITKQTKVEHTQKYNNKIAQDTLPKEVNKADKTEGVSDGQATENKAINSSGITQVTNNNLVPADSVKSPRNTVNAIEKQVNPLKEIQHEKVSSLAEPQLTKSELIQNREVTQSSETVQSSDVIKENKEVNQAAVDIKKTVTSNNQLATSADDANKTQAKQDEKVQLAASFAEQNQQKLAVQKEDEILVADKVIASVKREPFANSHFIDVSGKTTQTPQQIIDQQSVEILNPSVATEVTQSQKTNTQFQQETISLFRKDSAEAVKDKVMLMISQKLQQFDITLDPPELGNIQVRVNLQGEQAVVNFMVQSQQTKDALEQNMHKLKELLAEQGVDVGDANVEQQSQQSANEEDSAAGKNSQLNAELDSMAEANDVVAHTLSAKMIDFSTTSVDYYA